MFSFLCRDWMKAINSTVSGTLGWNFKGGLVLSEHPQREAKF